MSDVEPLAGYTIGLTAARRRDEFGAALERRGATVVQAPAIRIVPLADDTALRAATEACLAAPLDLVVATTGIGFRGWIEAADTWGLGEALLAHLAGTTILARGPKVRGAVRAAGLREQWSPESESSAEVLEHLLAGPPVAGLRIAVQLHGEPQPELVQTLVDAGAHVIEVPVYRWVEPDDVAPLERLLDAVIAGTVDAVAFTSAPAAASFLLTAERRGVAADVRRALTGPVVAACVGPVTAAPLVRVGVPVVAPERSRLGALVRTIVDEVPARRAVRLQAAGHALELRGQAVLVDGTLVPVPASGMALLRELAREPGRVVARATLQTVLPGAGSDPHALDVAIARLRAGLGDGRMLQTVVKRGYRLACAPADGPAVTA